MKIAIKKTKLEAPWSEEVWDVNVFPNGKDAITKKSKCIFTCKSDAAAVRFFNGLKELIERETIETVEIATKEKFIELLNARIKMAAGS